MSAAPATSGPTEPAAAKTKPFVVGFIYVGPKDDYGYKQAHAQGAAAVAKMPGVNVREEENVPETDAHFGRQAGNKPGRWRTISFM